MRILCDLVVISAALVASASAYGYKYSRNPYTGECKLQLSLPGGAGEKDAYSVVTNTRYGANDGKYHSGIYEGKYGTHAGSKYDGEASTVLTALANGNYGSSGSYGSSALGSSYGTGSYGGASYGGGSYGSSSGGGYGDSSGSNNYLSSSSSNYGSSNYGGGASGSYGGSYNEPTSASYGGAGSSNYGASSNGNRYESSSSDRNYGSSTSSANRGSSNRDRIPVVSTYPASSTYDRDRNTASSSYGSSSSSVYDQDRYGGSGSSSGYDRDRDTGSYGSSGAGYDRDDYSSRETSSYGSSSSGNRGSSSSDGYRPSYDRAPSRGTSSSSGSRGSSSSYGSSSGGSSSSSEKYGSGSSDRNWSKKQAATGNYDSAYSRKEFANEVLKTHNSYRARHTTPPVTLDEKMSIKAQEWAFDLAADRVPYGHSPDAVEGAVGENLAVINDPSATGKEVIDKWYGERYNYNFKNPTLVKSPLSKRNSHFTNIIWKSTRRIGVGKATSKDGRAFIVVSYWPPGNIVDVLEENVLPSRTDLGTDREQFY